MIDVSQLKMPSVSRECLEVLRLLDGDDIDQSALTNAIALDPILSSTLIKYGNSPAHRRGQEVTSVRAAVTVLGFRQVRAAAMVASMRGFCGEENALTAMFWEQGVAISTLARSIAARGFRRLADEVELLGLLQNMGALVLQTNFPDLYATLVDGVRQDGSFVHDAEREVFGVHRGDLVKALAERFRLPDRVVEVLAAFHARAVPRDADSDAHRLLAILWLAQVVAFRSSSAEDWLPEKFPAEVSSLTQLLDIDEDDLLDLGDDCENLVQQRLHGGGGGVKAARQASAA